MLNSLDPCLNLKNETLPDISNLKSQIKYASYKAPRITRQPDNIGDDKLLNLLIDSKKAFFLNLYKVLIRKGILKSFYYDTYTACYEEKDSGGNAHRYADEVYPVPGIL